MQSLEKKLTGKWCTPLLYFIKELLVSDLGVELYVLTVMPMRYAQLLGTFCIFKGSGVVIVLILNSDLESNKEMRNDDDNYL